LIPEYLNVVIFGSPYSYMNSRPIAALDDMLQAYKGERGGGAIALDAEVFSLGMTAPRP